LEPRRAKPAVGFSHCGKMGKGGGSTNPTVAEEV